MKVSSLLACLSVVFAAFSDNERCGTSNKGLMCNPQGQYGPCCSNNGFCGKSADYCSVDKGCQSGCTPTPAAAIPAGCGSGTCELKYLDKCQTPGHVSLTFDDGPDQYAPDLLSIADKLSVKLTLFVIGNKLSNLTHQQYLKQYYAAGHTIASHTFTHPFITKLSDDQIREEMTKTDDVIFNLIGVRPIYMRNPYADSNQRTMALLASMGYKSIFTSLDTEDTVYGNSDPSRILSNVVKGLQADPKVTPYVITQHETYKNSVNYLPQIVEEVRKRGYTIVDINTCFGTASAYK
ncbi:hypothetical protein DSO57_1009662 [Entomophthora muscae]|uniref:Uncharacterized protein n=1 Tax=Entomophthora muscae TaxID=34485 RepID=A0ACC2SVW6_9FUNG|nr:hypothetical protein DSO57_1009662 [Entomophthora muscae]